VKSAIFENSVVGRTEHRERKNIQENVSDIESMRSNYFFAQGTHPVGSFDVLKTVLGIVQRTIPSTAARYPLMEMY
jgi:hypothetical protein